MESCDIRVEISRAAFRACAAAFVLTLIPLIGIDAARAQTAAPTAEAAPTSDQAAKKATPKAKPKAKAAKAEPGAKKDPAVAQQQIDAGVAALAAGKAEPAIQQFTAALSGGSLAPAMMAKAQYQRGLAYRKVGKPALAISDLTQALWLKNGLSETERADALQNRIAAYRDAGLPDQEDAATVAAAGTPAKNAAATARVDTATAASSTGSIPLVPAARPAASLAPTQEAPAASPSSGVSGLFGNLFGGMGGSSGSTASTAAAAPAAPETARSSWNSAVEIKPASVTGPAKKVTASASQADEQLPWLQGNSTAAAPTPKASHGAVKTAAVVPAALPAPKAGGRFMLQVGQLKSAAEAQAVAAKLKQQLVVELAGREASIVAIQAGGFGTLHRVSFGPFLDAAETKTLCPKLLAAGHDCQVVHQ